MDRIGKPRSAASRAGESWCILRHGSPERSFVLSFAVGSFGTNDGVSSDCVCDESVSVFEGVNSMGSHSSLTIFLARSTEVSVRLACFVGGASLG